MRIPWIQEWNEHRRLRHEERKQERMVLRLADGYENFSKGFAKSFGVPFELAAVMAIQPRMKELVRDALPDILNALAEGNPGVDGGEYDGTLVASLDSQHGAFWGEAPAGEGGNESFRARRTGFDSGSKKYTIEYNGGSVTFFGGNTATLQGGKLENVNTDTYAYLLYVPGTGWSLSFGSSYQEAQNGQIVVPLWYFIYADDGAGTLTQETLGLVFIAEMANVVDKDVSSGNGGGTP